MSKFIIYFENATNGMTIAMMNDKGFTHDNVLIKAFAIPEAHNDLLPENILTFEIDTNVLIDETSFAYTTESGKAISTNWGNIKRALLEKGMSESTLDYYKSLFIFADSIGLWKMALELGWDLSSDEAILDIVDGIKGSIKDPMNKTPDLHVDLFIPEAIKNLFSEQTLNAIKDRSSEFRTNEVIDWRSSIGITTQLIGRLSSNLDMTLK